MYQGPGGSSLQTEVLSTFTTHVKLESEINVFLHTSRLYSFIGEYIGDGILHMLRVLNNLKFANS